MKTEKAYPSAQPAWIDGRYMRTRQDVYVELGVDVHHGSKRRRVRKLRALLNSGSGWFDGHFITTTEPTAVLKPSRFREDRGSGPLLQGHITTEFLTWDS